jgi:hypothetical protein
MGATSMFGSVIGFCATTPTTIANGNGTATFTCPGGNIGNVGTLPGQITITSIEIFLTSDYTYGGSVGNTVNTTFTTAAAFPTLPQTCVTTGQGSSNIGPCTPAALTAGIEAFETNTGGTLYTTQGGSSSSNIFSVTATAATMAGTVGASSAGVVIEFDYTTNPSGVPEPMTLTMMGVGLLGLGLFGSKRRKKV